MCNPSPAPAPTSASASSAPPEVKVADRVTVVERDAVESARDMMDEADDSRRSAFADEVKRRYEGRAGAGAAAVASVVNKDWDESAPYDETAATNSVKAEEGASDSVKAEGGASNLAAELDPDECDSLESDEDEDESEDCRDAAEAYVANVGCLQAAARHYPVLASLTGLGIGSPSTTASTSKTAGAVAAPSGPPQKANSKEAPRVVLLSKASAPASPLRSPESSSNGSKSNRRRIHPRKPHPASVSFSELVSVKEITPYNPTSVARCFYTAEELRRFRQEYLLGMNDDEDVFEMMQELADAVCMCVREIVWRGSGSLGRWAVS